MFASSRLAAAAALLGIVAMLPAAAHAGTMRRQVIVFQVDPGATTAESQPVVLSGTVRLARVLASQGAVPDPTPTATPTPSATPSPTATTTPTPTVTPTPSATPTPVPTDVAATLSLDAYLSPELGSIPLATATVSSTAAASLSGLANVPVSGTTNLSIVATNVSAAPRTFRVLLLVEE
jgi:hypothetical protein